ncbi:non-specific lipid-transfer protein 1-like [Mercurialis annua]|uniref:non-specific lipid-transfer protein 1-like n=1 Tax=Mercurialis annua TaxID=3986 RepID=UPI00215FF7A3|nr:non-specific lipid-transfer protein 1-like [Mercurialis annua]
MASNKVESVLVLLAVISSMLVITPNVYAEISCAEITVLLVPCIPYGILGGDVPESCCSGIKDSFALVKTNEDLMLKCQCVEDVAALIPGLNYTKVNELPAKCDTTSPYIVSPDTDCSKVHL